MAKCYLVSGIVSFRGKDYTKAKLFLLQAMEFYKDDFRTHIYLIQVMKKINDDNSKEYIKSVAAFTSRKEAEITDGKRLAYQIMLSDSPPAEFLNKLSTLKNDIYSAAFVLAEYARLKNDKQTYIAANSIADKNTAEVRIGSDREK